MNEKILKQIGYILRKEKDKYLKEVYNLEDNKGFWLYDNMDFSTKRRLLVDGRLNTIKYKYYSPKDLFIYFCIRKKGKILMWGEYNGIVQPVIATEKKLTQEQFEELKKWIIDLENQNKIVNISDL